MSREGSQKCYVQHRLRESAEDVHRLLQRGAFFYVCGDAANMAPEVRAALAQIIAQQRKISVVEAENAVSDMRATGRYQVRVLQYYTVMAETAMPVSRNHRC